MIIQNVHIFNGEPVTGTSDIHISQEGIITAITGSGAPTPGEDMIDGRGMLALPGLTDAHRHVWQAPFKGVAADLMLLEYLDKVAGGIGSQISAEELYYINLYGYIQCALAGITTVFDWSHIMNSAEHADAAVQAAVDSGLNVLFLHATPATERDKYWNQSITRHDPYIETLVARHGHAFPNVRIGMGIRGPEFATMDVNRADIGLADALGIPASMHIGSSLLGKIHKPALQLAEQGLLTQNLNLVHCNTLSHEEMSLIAQAGSLVTITPEAEMQTGLGEPAARFMADIPGLKWSIGTDIPTGSTDSLLFQQRLLLQYYRSLVNHRVIENMEFPVQMPYAANKFFFDSMESANAYAGLNTSARIGAGSKACFSLFRLEGLNNRAFLQNPAFYYLQEPNIDTIVINGKLALQSGQWLAHDLESIERNVSSIVARIMGRF
ncbi:amidohydrolase family protein [Dyadobacter fermentans]|uniref:Amidohydrolase n=1 Tax=Dyadobacter fermentans (strain ATCC 700827 / DSM 18053 / CIP 107007 / KCTC 52180 / NS114) TaxID=471854 RepID=C6VZJ7_DYAFD|nr:amidohydrolase family protein [Dyadobacter fermentans]ACT93475.1 amidohydrolase [Dyadobacter fermentans DSM 18053]